MAGSGLTEPAAAVRFLPSRLARYMASSEFVGLDERAQLLGKMRGTCECLALEQHDEFLATDPVHAVGHADAQADDVGNPPQHFVARRMTVAVVDGLEVVEVEKQQR